ncbi:hypothetical protein [Bifidobacterium pseudolongum]|nr:hypothetical protein [Bifidobacterium pseudolongum]
MSDEAPPGCVIVVSSLKPLRAAVALSSSVKYRGTGTRIVVP